MLTLHVELTAGLKLLNSNQRIHFRTRAKLTEILREDARTAVLAPLGLTEPIAEPVMQRAHILGVLCPPSRRRADPANWYPSFKAAVDGVVDAGVLADDDHTRVVGPDMRIGPVVKGGRLLLTVREVSEEEFASLKAGELWLPLRPDEV